MSYLYAAFAIVWVVLIAYIINLMRLRRSLNKEIDSLKNMK